MKPYGRESISRTVHGNDSAEQDRDQQDRCEPGPQVEDQSNAASDFGGNDDLSERRRQADLAEKLSLDQPTEEFGGIYAVYLPDSNPAAKVRAFIDFCAEHFAPEPPWDRGR